MMVYYRIFIFTIGINYPNLYEILYWYSKRNRNINDKMINLIKQFKVLEKEKYQQFIMIISLKNFG
jgi:hypothetical protein